jgi:DsbC/DsbD-like thiol-disulfide interchange protein
MELKLYSKTLRRLLPATLLCALLPAQTSSPGHLKLGDLPKVAAKRGETVQVKVPMSVDPGFHVNSNKPNEEYLIPLKLTWKSTGPLEAGAIAYPKPAEEKYEFSEKPLSVFTGRFDVATPFKIPAGAPVGPGVATGQLRYQACNDKACFPPKTIEISLPYSVQ